MEHGEGDGTLCGPAPDSWTVQLHRYSKVDEIPFKGTPAAFYTKATLFENERSTPNNRLNEPIPRPDPNTDCTRVQFLLYGPTWQFGYAEAVSAPGGSSHVTVYAGDGLMERISEWWQPMRAELARQGWINIHPDARATSPTPTKIAAGEIIGRDQTITNIAGGDVVGRDKITHIHGADLDRSVQLPKLILKLVKLGSQRSYHDEVVVEQPATLPAFRDHVFGFVLENIAESTAAKGIGIRIEAFWRGDAPLYPLVFAPPRRPEGWIAVENQLTNDQAAVMTMTAPNLISFHRQPNEWVNFRLSLQERLNGYILFLYRVSSADPQVDGSGELRLYFQ